MKNFFNRSLITILFILSLLIAQIILVSDIDVLAEGEGKVYKFAGGYNHPPYEYVDKKGEFVGFNIDIIKAIGEDQDINIEIVPMEWSYAVSSLSLGDVDGVIGMSKSKDREEKFKFISPNLIVDEVIFASSHSVSINRLEDLEGLKVGYQANDRNEENILKIPKVVAVPKVNQELALLALKNKELDAVLGTKLVGTYHLQKNKLVNEIQIVGEPINNLEYGIAIGKEDMELFQILEDGLANIKEKNIHDKIYSKWFRKGEVTLAETIKRYKREVLFFAIFIILIILFLTRYNTLLKNQVRKRTIQLERANRELVGRQKEVYHLAYFDPITSLPNRTRFIKELDDLLDRRNNLDNPFAVLFLDLDKFKHVNDTLGHETGDYILKLLSDRLSSLIKDDGMLAKVGGDEYFILYPDIEDRNEPVLLARKIIEAFKEPFYVEDYEIYLTTSIGIAVYPDAGLDSSTLIKNSDLALYKAKELGGNSYCLYGIEIKSQGLDRMLLLNQLRQAVEGDQLRIHYQPQIDMETGEIIGLEALMRWDHPDKGLLYPDEFIPLAEESG